MRDILFKAKAINRDNGYHRTNYKNGDWVYGLITRLFDDRFQNLPAEMTDENGVSRIEIDHNTICQYTGLNDNHGNKIWENDILCSNRKEKYFVKWRFCGFELLHRACATPIYAYAGTDLYVNEHTLNLEALGNIYDNPELLEGSGEDD